RTADSPAPSGPHEARGRDRRAVRHAPGAALERHRGRPPRRPVRTVAFESSWAFLVNECRDLLRARKNDGGAVSLHAGADNDRLACRRSLGAAIRLEPQIEFPPGAALAVAGEDAVGIAAVTDRAHLAGRVGALEIRQPVFRR